VRQIRIYTNETLNVSNVIVLKDQIYHYLNNVLKAKETQKIVLFNNTGYDFYGHIKNITKNTFEVFIEKKIFYENAKSNFEVAFSVCKNSCSDLIVQKLTELGVDKIQPLISENSIFNNKKLDKEKKNSHWKKISISACEQSERSYLPLIKPIISFDDYIKNCSYDQKIILDTEAEKMLSRVYKKNQSSCSILIGPEGDFTKEEYNIAKKLNFSPASLGDNILRVETAVIAAFSYIKLRT